MTVGTFNKCCIWIDLRIGSFIIAYLLLIGRSLQLIFSCVHLSGINMYLSEYMNHNLVLVHEDLEFAKLILSFEILLLTFELLINVALINGLLKRIQDQVQMFYVGGAVFEALKLIILTMVIMRYAHIMAKRYGPQEWTTLVLRILSHLLYIYFLSAIRSYYFKMRQEETTRRWNVFSDSRIQLTVNK